MGNQQRQHYLFGQGIVAVLQVEQTQIHPRPVILKQVKHNRRNTGTVRRRELMREWSASCVPRR
jgi:hypothetical protein